MIDRCLAKNPAQRFHSAHDLAFALRGLLSVGGEKTRGAAGPHSVRRRWLTVIAAVIAIAAAGLLYLRSHAQSIYSLAVLPFANSSGSADADYLSDGITESLIGSLSELPNLKVMSSSAVARYKGKTPDIPSVGREVGVRAVLTGRITQRGDSLTVSAELVDAKDNSHLWGERYKRQLADALAVQNEIAHQIVEKLRLPISDTQMKRMATRQTANPEAYQLYLKGRYFAAQFTPEGLDKGMNYFRQAIALDPGYALAYDGMSYYYTLIEDLSVAPAEVMPKSEAAARKAIELDDSLVQPHVEQAYNYTSYDYDWPAAEREFQRAFSINPNYAPAHEFYSQYLISQGRIDQAIQEAQRAVELDPLSPEIHSFLDWTLYFARRYDQSMADLHTTLEIDPNYPFALYVLGEVYAQQGRFDDAIAAERKSVQNFGDAGSSYMQAEIARDHALAGRRSEAIQAVRDLLGRSQSIHVAPYGIATVYAALGDKDQAIAQLEQAWAQRSQFLDFLKVDPAFDGVRSDPRFQNLVARMKLP